MTVRMILPHTPAMTVHAGRSVTEFPSVTSKDGWNRLDLMTRDTRRTGIIRLTFMA
jgi:hypothetical protein